MSPPDGILEASNSSTIALSVGTLIGAHISDEGSAQPNMHSPFPQVHATRCVKGIPFQCRTNAPSAKPGGGDTEVSSNDAMMGRTSTKQRCWCSVEPLSPQFSDSYKNVILNYIIILIKRVQIQIFLSFFAPQKNFILSVSLPFCIGSNFCPSLSIMIIFIVRFRCSRSFQSRGHTYSWNPLMTVCS